MLLQLVLANLALAQPTTARIINGTPSSPGTFPWMAAVHLNGYDPADRNYGTFCGGTLIHPQWVLTAAHCMEKIAPTPNTLAVTFGRTNLGEFGTGLTVPVQSYIVHPSFKLSTMTDDAALLKLESPVNIEPVALAYSLDTGVAGAAATIVGWGTLNADLKLISNSLQQARIPIQSDTNCLDNLATHLYPASQFCAGRLASSDVEHNGVDACYGDSGGPLLIVDENGVTREAGITSWGFGCASSKFYGVWSRVPSFIPWISLYVPLPPHLRVAPVITGELSPGHVVSCESGNVDGNVSGMQYRWEDSTGAAITSQNVAAFSLRQSDVGRTIRCTVQAHGPGGTSVSASSGWVGPIQGRAAGRSIGDVKPPGIKKIQLKCRKNLCTLGVTASDPAPGASGVKTVFVQAAWQGRVCSLVSGRRACLVRTAALGPVAAGSDSRYRYFTFSVPGSGSATMQIRASDKQGNLSTVRSYRAKV